METRTSSTANMMSVLDKTPLGRHVKPLVDENSTYSPTTVSAALAKCHEPNSGTIGTVVSIFNATHSEGSILCPFRKSATFSPEAFARSLHLGTMRIWKPDGNIDEARWQQFVDFAAEDYDDKRIIKRSKIRDYLIKCCNEDPEELHTGRNANSLFSSKPMQESASPPAWDQVFRLCTEGWIVKDGKVEEPYLTVDAVREFFEDTWALFKKAEDGILPVPKPEITTEITPSMGFKK